MAKRSLALQLDEAVQWMLVSLQPRPEETPDRELASLTRVAQVLRDLPRKEFRVALKSDLQRRASMSEGKATSAAGTGEAKAKTVQYQRPGLTGITPYIIVRPAAQFIEFLKSAFEGVERMRMPAPDGSIMHAEVAIGNGAIEVSDGNEQYPTAPGAVHLYVDDPDATYARTLQAGATSFYAPTDDHPSGDRWGAVKDSFGNHWYIAKPRGWTPGPEGLRSVQPYLHLREAHKMIPFMETVFGAEALGVHKSPHGTVLHATMRIGNATLEIDEAHGEYQPMPCHLHVYVPDTDAVYARALQSGATSIEVPQNAPYGDRSPYGLSCGTSMDVAPDCSARAYTASVSGTYTCRWHGIGWNSPCASSISSVALPIRIVPCSTAPSGDLATPRASAPNAASINGIILCASRRCKKGCTLRTPSGPGVHPPGFAMY